MKPAWPYFETIELPANESAVDSQALSAIQTVAPGLPKVVSEGREKLTPAAETKNEKADVAYEPVAPVEANLQRSFLQRKLLNFTKEHTMPENTQKQESNEKAVNQSNDQASESQEQQLQDLEEKKEVKGGWPKPTGGVGGGSTNI